MKCISYKSGYKYQIVEDYPVLIPIKPPKGEDIVTDYIELDKKGLLTIKKGYAWDGPSGPTIDTHTFMRGSLVHDALYQLMRNEKLLKKEHRKAADKLIQEMCRDDGMNSIRAWVVYSVLRLAGGRAADHKNKKPVISAPKGVEEVKATSE